MASGNPDSYVNGAQSSSDRGGERFTLPSLPLIGIVFGCQIVLVKVKVHIGFSPDTTYIYVFTRTSARFP